MKQLAIVLLALALVLPSGNVFAQVDQPSVSASAEPREVEVGEAFSVSMTVTVDASSPSPGDPRLALPEALKASPPSISSQTQISFVNGHMSRRSGITATWQVVATHAGTFVVTPSVSWNGKKLAANPLRVAVHAATPGGRRRPQPGPSPNPFDPFGMFPRLPGFPLDMPEPEPQALPVDPELSLDAPLDSRIFLRSVVDQKSAVVGEQVTLTIYVYVRDTSIRGPKDQHEPTVSDFFSRDLMPPGDPQERAVAINGVVWRVQPILKRALFPLRAGDLEIGPMRATFVGGRGGADVPRESQRIMIHVSEPPLAGRPVGYQVGDVGSYSLSVSVDPRSSEVGGAVAVIATLSGVGSVPNAIRVPASTSVEWLEPQVREAIDIENGKIKGSRTFSYVVRPKIAGNVDLGELTLPYWNPERRAYEQARASLGTIQVAPPKTPLAAKDPAVVRDPWSPLAPARTELAGYSRAREPLTEKPFYWLGLVVGPLAVVVGSAGSRGMRRLRALLERRKKSAENGIEIALAQARDARKRDDRAALAAALERAVYLAIERATALKARALLVEQIPAALEERRVPRELAVEIKELLGSIEATRFTPESAPDAKELADRAASAVRRLGRLPAVEKVA